MTALVFVCSLLFGVSIERPKSERLAVSPFDSLTVFPTLQLPKSIKAPKPAIPLIPLIPPLLGLLLEIAKEYGPDVVKGLKDWNRPSPPTGPEADKTRLPFGQLMADREQVKEWEVFRVYANEDSTFSFASHTGFLTAEGGGGGIAIANRDEIGDWQKWTVIDLLDGKFGLRSKSKHYLCVNGDGKKVTADRDALGPWETFTLDRDVAKKTCSFKCWNGKYLSAQP